ncbi:MAG: holo-ACP synthase [Acidobacteriota bacterium]
MAILGIGMDLVDVERIGRIYRRHGAAFVARICQDGECKPYRGQALIEHLAGLFAAKEAMFKALGTGWAKGVGFRQVEVTRAPSGAPGYRLHGAAAARATQLGVVSTHLSITHERHLAAAVAVLEGEFPASGEVG